MNGYVCFYAKQQIEVRAYSTFEAHQKAIEHFKVRPKQRHMISVVLAEKGGEQVVHNPMF